jgi:hypothetical protein
MYIRKERLKMVWKRLAKRMLVTIECYNSEVVCHDALYGVVPVYISLIR